MICRWSARCRPCPEPHPAPCGSRSRGRSPRGALHAIDGNDRRDRASPSRDDRRLAAPLDTVDDARPAMLQIPDGPLVDECRRIPVHIAVCVGKGRVAVSGGALEALPARGQPRGGRPSRRTAKAGPLQAGRHRPRSTAASRTCHAQLQVYACTRRQIATAPLPEAAPDPWLADDLHVKGNVRRREDATAFFLGSDPNYFFLARRRHRLVKFDEQPIDERRVA